MKRKYILFLICSFFLGGVSAQTLEQARTLFTKGEYEQAKPVNFFFNLQVTLQTKIIKTLDTISNKIVYIPFITTDFN